MQEKDDQKFSNTKTEDWSAKEVTEQATNLMSDEVQRQMLRGDETKGDAEERDVVGNIDTSETPQGRESTKNNKSDADNL